MQLKAGKGPTPKEQHWFPELQVAALQVICSAWRQIPKVVEEAILIKDRGSRLYPGCFLHPSSDGLQPSSDGLSNLIAMMASNLIASSSTLAAMASNPNSDGLSTLIAMMASNLIAMTASNLIAMASNLVT